MLQFIPRSTRRLIDIGCGEGRFGEAVKQTIPDCEVWGLEPETMAAQAAATRCDRVINTSLQNADELPQRYFQAVTMNDVLEHMPQPEPSLAAAARLLSDDGVLILSLPNVAFYINILDLVFRNDWEYRDYGILDRTHLRFFTIKSTVRLLERNGFEVLKATGINASRPKLHYHALFSIFPSVTKHMLYPQFAVVAKPKPA